MNEIKKALSALATEIQTQPLHRSRFAASVVSISDDYSCVKVKLCTGSIIDVPVSLLKNVTYLGTASNENERRGIASGEIDISTDAGMLIQQMAHEITRLSGSLQTAHEQLLRFQGADTNKTLVQTEQVPATESKKRMSPFDIPLPYSVIKLPFMAVAGSPHKLWYRTPEFQYLKDWSVEPLHCV